VQNLLRRQQLTAALSLAPRRLPVCARQQQDEFLATETGTQVVRIGCCGVDSLGHAPQALVTLHVAIVIVVLLEVIDIDDHERQRVAAFARFFPLYGIESVEHAPVGDTG